MLRRVQRSGCVVRRGLTDENNAANFFIYPIKGADEKAVRAGEQPSFFEIRGGIFFAFLIGKLCKTHERVWRV